MTQRDIDSRLFLIDSVRKDYKKIQDHANIFIKILHTNFNVGYIINIKTGDIIDNRFEFKFLGHNFRIIFEVSYNLLERKFNYGEINTYYLCDDIKELILSYNFDNLGVIFLKYRINITNIELLSNKLDNDGNPRINLTENIFSSFYYADMFDAIMNYASNKDLKF
jgi:hypothetical protein